MDYFIIFAFLKKYNLEPMIKIKSGFPGERAIILPPSIVDEFQKTEFGNVLYMTDIGFYPNAMFHYRKRSRQENKQFILIYCVEGMGWIEIEGVKFKIDTNQVIILPKEKAHAYGSNEKNPWSIYWVHFDGEMGKYFATDLEKPKLICTENNSRIEDRIKLFDEIFDTLKNGYSNSNLMYSVVCLIHFLSTFKFLEVYRNSTNSSKQTNDIVTRTIHFMRENLHRKIQLKEIADYSGLSVSHLSALFLKKAGFTLIGYLAQLKIQQACHYIDFTDLKMNQIAQKIGIEDPFYFTRLFTKIMGMSPTKYKNTKKG